MRCLTKAISMLGLGAYIYAGEDLPQEADTSGAPPEARKAAKENGVKKVAEKKAHAKKKEPEKKEPDGDVDDFNDEVGADIADEEGAKEVADLLIQFANTNSSSLKSLAMFWKKNAAVLDKLDEEYPEEFDRVKAEFTRLRKEIQSQE
jgi:hypothetical protein